MYAHDGWDYVRRLSLESPAILGSSAAERLALEAWARPDQHQQWTRMMVLWCLGRVGSSALDGMLDEAAVDGRSGWSGMRNN